MDNNVRIEGNGSAKENASALVIMSAKNTLKNVEKQKKRQYVLFGILLAEGIIALVGGIILLVFTKVLPIGIVLALLGVFIIITITVMNLRTFKKLNVIKKRAEEYLASATESVADRELDSTVEAREKLKNE